MTRYDQWLERGPVDALTEAELDDDTDTEDDGPDPDRQRDDAMERTWPDE